MARILPLPAEAISQIHSSKHITSLQGVVLSLLENSLDVGSNRVEINIDFRRGGCMVEDNGSGIPPAEFGEAGGLGRMYHTSKLDNFAQHELHGNAGTYLASLAALSLLSISSRHVGRDDTAMLTMHQGKIIARCSSVGEAQQLIGHGTRITVRDLFGSMPVRVKQRALGTESSNEDEKAWHELKAGAVALLLAWHRPCAVKLRDANDDGRNVRVAGSHHSISAALTEKSLARLDGKATNFDYRDLLPILFQTGFTPADSRSSWVPVSARTSRLSVKGAICLDPAPTKQCQFLSISIYPCSASSGHHELYDAVNKIFTNSSFGTTEDDPEVDAAQKDRHRHDRRYKAEGYTQKQVHGRKGVDRWPMFVLQVRFASGAIHVTERDNLSEGQLKALIDMLEAVTTQWLTANHFRPRKRRQRKNETQQSPAIASSSPSRPSSALSTLRQAPYTPVTNSPNLKRAAILDHGTASLKRRRIIDLSDGAGPLLSRDSAPPHSCGHSFDTWSRIKSGRGVSFDERPLSKGPPSASAANPSMFANHEVIRDAKSVESPPKTHKLPKTTDIEAHNSIVAFAPSDENVVSSEDFGSIDEPGLLATVEPDVSNDGQRIDGEDGSLAVLETNVLTGDDPIAEWIDPRTKQVFRVNTRTGVVLPLERAKTATQSASDTKLSPARHCAAIDIAKTPAGKSLSLSRRAASTSSQGLRKPASVPAFLKDWRNPVFARQAEMQIPVASFDGPGIDVAEAERKRCAHGAPSLHSVETSSSLLSKLSKSALKHVRVIRQVDRKFILCDLPSEQAAESDTLVLVDQHAASERIILEHLLAELCAPIDPASSAAFIKTDTDVRSSVNTALLSRSLRFDISAAESELFQKQAQHFARWGILYDLSSREDPPSASQVRAPTQVHTIGVRALPNGIVERCTIFPSLLVELLRSEVWTAAESHRRSNAGPEAAGIVQDMDNEDHSWLRHIGSCPKGIVDMLNSRACRSAIMFNDVLSIERCQELLADLSRCAFPFMCAHGRVSMVPLCKSKSGRETTKVPHKVFSSEAREETTGFTNVFKQWRAHALSHIHRQS